MGDSRNKISEEKMVPVLFDGGIIPTLSEELPSDVIALRELIKNAYDASADSVRLNLNTQRKVLTIDDDGDGMDAVGLQRLFHLGRSGKNYGKFFESTRSKEKRYQQGSKGIGFLAALHFGSFVTWTSKKEGEEGSRIQCDRTYLESLTDLSEAELKLSPYAKPDRGTRIEVNLEDYRYTSLLDCFTNDEIRAKICNTFRKSNLSIIISIDNDVLKSERVSDFTTSALKRHLFYAKIEHESKTVAIYNAEQFIDSFDIPECHPDCKINGEIVILDLKGTRTSVITKLFINHNRSLTPLVYINDNLYEDYTLFDPDILRKTQNTQVMAQMMGYIDIECDSESMKFNTDRTRLSQNPLSDSIYSCLKKINENIQAIASAHKNDNGIKKGFTIPKLHGTYARISLRGISTYEITSTPINLRDFIYIAKDSKNQDISLEKIDVYINDQKSDTGILPSQTLPCSIIVHFKYEDKEIGLIAAEKELVFKDKPSPKVKINLLSHNIVEAKNSYAKVCSRLMNEINSLSTARYAEVISCGLRAIFELSVYSLRNVTGIPKDLRTPQSTEAAIPAIFNHIRDNKIVHQKVALHSAIGFDDLKNFEVDKFVQAYKTSHRGAHKSSALLSPSDMKDIGMRASEFAHIVSVLLMLYRNGKL